MDENHVSLVERFNRAAINAVRKIGRDIGIAAATNLACMATGIQPVMYTGQPLSDQFWACAWGTGVMTLGITAGRYVGGALGAIFDAVSHRDDGKFRTATAAVGGTIGGAGSLFIWENMLWAFKGFD